MKKISHKQYAKRNIIIKNATTLMNEVGFENLTIRMICDAASISTGTFYHYFKSKDELVIELFAFIDDYFEENIIEKLNNEDELLNVIMFCKSFAEYVALCGVARSKLINSMFPPYRKGEINEESKRILNAELLKIIEHGQNKGQITTKYMVEQLVEMILVMIRGYCFDWGRREGAYDLVDHTEKLITLFVDSLRING